MIKKWAEIKAKIAAAKSVECLEAIVDDVNIAFLADISELEPIDWQAFNELLRDRMQEIETAS